jgi:hypothetical protein
LWSLLTALHPAKNNVSHINLYIKFENEIKIDKFPVHINDIAKIERVNNLKINVFELKGKGNIISDYYLEPRSI